MVASQSKKIWLALLSSVQSVRCLARIHGRIITGGHGDDLLCQTKLASTYALMGDMSRAVTVFETIENPDLYLWKVMLRWYLVGGKFTLAVGAYKRMRLADRPPDNVVYAGVLKAAAELRDLRIGETLHGDIVKAGSPDGFLLNSLLELYGKCGALESARSLFDEIPDRDVVSWTCMISAYVHNDRAAEGLLLFNRMRELNSEPNAFTVGILLAACSMLDTLHQGKWIHGYVIKRRMAANPFIATGLLDMYAKCRLLDDARRVYDLLPAIDLISWTAMISAYAQSGVPLRAVELFSIVTDLKPNSFTIASALSASSQLGDPILGKNLHGLAVKLRLEEETQVRNALLTMYTRCRLFPYAYQLFESSPLRDVISWNTMIVGYSQNRLAEEALFLFKRMRSADGLTPDAVSLVGVLSACAHAGDLSAGTQCHADATKRGVIWNIFVATALLDLYAKSGDAAAARAVFNSTGSKNHVTWCAMISCSSAHGDPAESLALFHEMEANDLSHNDAVFTATLAACRHAGMLQEGQEVFHRIMHPSTKHYSSMVDLLSRTGRLEEAIEFMENMPEEPSVAIWGAFLHGCRLHSRMELGESAIQRMLELHPQNASYYQLISNLYASEGRWSDAAKIRKLMKSRGLHKSPGYSIST